MSVFTFVVDESLSLMYADHCFDFATLCVCNECRCLFCKAGLALAVFGIVSHFPTFQAMYGVTIDLLETQCRYAIYC